MTIVLENKRAKKSALNSSQKTFQRLKNKVEKFQKELKNHEKMLDSLIEFYHNRINPDKIARREALIEFVKFMYTYYHTNPPLSRANLDILKELIVEKVESILSSDIFNDADQEMCAIFKEFEGVGYDEVVSYEMDVMKNELEGMFQGIGINLDLSKVSHTDSEEDAMKKLFEAMNVSKEEMSFNEKPKTKKQLEKESRRKELEELQKKGLSSIYKQLAKAFHPDLEQDPTQKVEKELLMKKLTAAYDNDDLHTMLSLQMMQMKSTAVGNESLDEDKIKIFNSILKEQVEELEMRIATLIMHPKYLHIQQYVETDGFPPFLVLRAVYNDLKNEGEYVQSLMKGLLNKNKDKVVRSIICKYRRECVKNNC